MQLFTGLPQTCGQITGSAPLVGFYVPIDFSSSNVSAETAVPFSDAHETRPHLFAWYGVAWG